MKVLKSYPSFNPRRYSNPWVAKVNPKTAKPDFSVKVGGYTGGFNRGEAGDLFIYEPEEGAVYMYGQKANHGGDSERFYAKYVNGSFVEVTTETLLQSLSESSGRKENDMGHAGMDEVISSLYHRLPATDEVYSAAQRLDEGKEVIEDVTKRWENGEKFTYSGVSSATLFGSEPEKRENDSEKEVIACGNQLHGLLQGVIMRHWLKQLSRDEAVALKNLLTMRMTNDYKYTEFGCGYNIVEGVTVKSIPDFVRHWNEQHPDEEPIEE